MRLNAKSHPSIEQTPYAPYKKSGVNRLLNLRVKINNELRRIRRKIHSEKIPAEKIRLINAYEDLMYTLKVPAKR